LRVNEAKRRPPPGSSTHDSDRRARGLPWAIDDYPAGPGTLALAFQASVACAPDRVALRTPGGDERLTWGQYGAARPLAGR
jgi:hypothetical protein